MNFNQTFIDFECTVLQQYLASFFQIFFVVFYTNFKTNKIYKISACSTTPIDLKYNNFVIEARKYNKNLIQSISHRALWRQNCRSEYQFYITFLLCFFYFNRVHAIYTHTVAYLSNVRAKIQPFKQFFLLYFTNNKKNTHIRLSTSYNF